jgi:hypothetical protein
MPGLNPWRIESVMHRKGSAGASPHRVSLARIHAVEDGGRKRLRQDVQDEQDGMPPKEPSPKQATLISDVILLFHPVNPVHPVRFQGFNCMVPAQARIRGCFRACHPSSIKNSAENKSVTGEACSGTFIGTQSPVTTLPLRSNKFSLPAPSVE